MRASNHSWPVTVVLIALCVGCAAPVKKDKQKEAQSLEAQIEQLERELRQHPSDGRKRVELVKRRTEILVQLLGEAEHARETGDLAAAEKKYRRVLRIDPSNERAWSGLELIGQQRKDSALLEQAEQAAEKGEKEKALTLLDAVLAEDPHSERARNLKRSMRAAEPQKQATPPALRSKLTRPVTLEFRDANLKMVFELLTRSSGINFVLDRDIRSDQKASLFVKQTSVEDALDLLLLTNRLEKKVLNEKSVLIYPNTPEKAREYQDVVIRGFYLSYADAKQMAGMLKSLLKTPELHVDDKLNLILMRDTPDVIALAERLIAFEDLSEPEVMLELEVLEIQRSKLQELGILFPQQVTLSLLPSSGSTLTLNDLRNINSSRVGVGLPDTIINLKKELDNANLLANPRIRARNKEKARILIGDKVPVITTTSTATGFVSESVQYLDVGLKLEIEPNVYLRDEVAMRVALEVSSIVKEIKSTSGTLTYQIGTRNAATLLSLKDGETQILAGLISDADRVNSSRVPGLGDFPVLGRLFSSSKDDKQKTEIVLSITPRLVRNIRRPDSYNDPIWYGTEAGVRPKPVRLGSLDLDVSDAEPSEAKPQARRDDVAAAARVAPSAAAAAIPSGPGVLMLDAPNQVKAGEKFAVTLKVQSGDALRSLPFQIGFDPTVFQAVEVQEGDFFKQNKAATNFASNIDPAGGKVYVGVSRSDLEGARGQGAVAVIVFRALAAGKAGNVTVLAASPVGSKNPNVSLSMPAPAPISVSP